MKNYIQYLQEFYLDEKSAEEFPKGEWVDVQLDELDDDLIKKLWNLYEITYKDIGLTVENIIQLRTKYKIVKLIDIDDDPEPDAFIIYKITSFGNKLALLGSDGNKNSKKFLILKALDLLKTNGWYGEASHKFAEILASGNTPIVKNEEDVRKILKGKEIIWNGDGSYNRNISGKINVDKIMFGRPIK